MKSINQTEMRELAEILNWWQNTLSPMERLFRIDEYYPLKKTTQLKTKEIKNIWEKELSNLNLTKKNYDNRTFPILYANKEFSNKSLWLVNDEFSTYHFNYDTVIEFYQKGLLSTNKKPL